MEYTNLCNNAGNSKPRMGVRLRYEKMFQVFTDTQEETDRCWNAFVKDGGLEIASWCKDKFGLSWQIVPRVLTPTPHLRSARWKR